MFYIFQYLNSASACLELNTTIYWCSTFIHVFRSRAHFVIAWFQIVFKSTDILFLPEHGRGWCQKTGVFYWIMTATVLRFHSSHGITDIHSQHQLNIFKGQASGLWDEQSNEKEFEG
jgi:hypothetical protein